ncbi:MAG: 16S rRNA (cytidine(1402)-2'-O)-methyltransferase [Bacteroidales bacterium]|nr:MAG: 16S rRNA (cytidine(1402)-2'-O)-methyltransferase [Bacteroidales bacterium]
MSRLYLVPTPIGNIKDITLRSLDILASVELILAENTRKTTHLLRHFKIDKEIQSYHKFNEHKKVHGLVRQIKAGKSMALVTDAGTPSISDPGFLLVRTCLENDIEIECLPGPSAFIPALVNSGLPSDRFCFEGFLPHRKGRTKRLASLADETRTIILYESPHRLIKTLEQLSEYLGDNRSASISRELTKIHEETVRGTIRELISYYKDHTLKGEFVIIVGGLPS